MATKATVNTSDGVLLLSSKEHLIRKTGIGTSWLDARIGMFFTFVPTANDNAASVTETDVTAGPVDYFFFGLKDSSANLPRTSGSKFLGLVMGRGGNIYMVSNSSGESHWGNSTNTAGNGAHFISQNGTTEISNVAIPADNIDAWQIPVFSTGTVNRLLAIKFEVTDFGLSTQKVTMHFNSVRTAFSNVSDASLQAQLVGASWAAPTTSFWLAADWNSGGVALPLPEYFYVRSPFISNRIRISNYGAVKVS